MPAGRTGRRRGPRVRLPAIASGARRVCTARPLRRGDPRMDSRALDSRGADHGSPRGGEVVGLLAVSSKPDESWIDQLYLLPERIGAGIGTVLLERALAELPPPIRLYTFQANARARRFYEARGFEAIAFGDGSHNEERCPDVL